MTHVAGAAWRTGCKGWGSHQVLIGEPPVSYPTKASVWPPGQAAVAKECFTSRKVFPCKKKILGDFVWQGTMEQGVVAVLEQLKQILEQSAAKRRPQHHHSQPREASDGLFGMAVSARGEWEHRIRMLPKYWQVPKYLSISQAEFVLATQNVCFFKSYHFLHSTYFTCIHFCMQQAEHAENV